MLRLRWLVVPLAGLILLGAASAAGSPDAAITQAALAPYRDELLRDAPALCSDLAPAVAATIVPDSSMGMSCEQAAQNVFSVAAAPGLSRQSILSLRVSASHLKVDGDHASGVFSLLTTESFEAHGISGEKILSLGRYRLNLEEIAGRWVVSSPVRLFAASDCQLESHSHCRPGVIDAFFMLGVALGPTSDEQIPTPAAVRRASRRERQEFAAGRQVFIQTACLACHKIDEQGNHGPGPNLTHVGSQLSSQQIAHALISPRQPMPSFKRLPARKFRDLIRFLSLMR